MNAPAAGSRALVMLSGGLDSAVALHWSLERGYVVDALIVHWSGQADGERRAAVRVAANAGVRLRVVDAPWMEAPPDAEPEGYIPQRNLAFYGIAAHVAEREGYDAIVGGHTREDGEDLPDATAAFFERVESLVAAGSADHRSPRIVLPLIHLDKARVAALGRRLGVDVEATWSCYRDAAEPCGACPACRERIAVLDGPATAT